MTRMTCWRALVAVVTATVLMTLPAKAQQPSAVDRGGYQIGAGDVLDISVWKNAELSRQVTVRPDGMISLPLVNDVHAAGLTPMELRELLAKKLSEYVPSAEVSVIVNRVRSYSVSVVGSVAKPGRFVLSSPTTVLEAIALAGGLTEFASRRSITVLRTEGKGATTRVPFNYNDALAGEASENLLLRAGDVVVVP
jgi:polysaccharide export outer membrane protein